MSITAARERRAKRNAQTKREILDAAWALARENGLAAFSMRDLGDRVGLRAQSLYGYFPSKHAIFDAMYAEANQPICDVIAAIPVGQDPRDRLRRYAQAFLKFATEDPVRYQLLYQRTIPGFEPTAESYEIAVRGLEYTRRALRECGITSQRAMDAWTAVLSGVAAQQNSNEPGGKRWLRLPDDITAMYLAHYLPKAPAETSSDHEGHSRRRRATARTRRGDAPRRNRGRPVAGHGG